MQPDGPTLERKLKEYIYRMQKRLGWQVSLDRIYKAKTLYRAVIIVHLYDDGSDGGEPVKLYYSTTANRWKKADPSGRNNR